MTCKPKVAKTYFIVSMPIIYTGIIYTTHNK